MPLRYLFRKLLYGGEASLRGYERRCADRIAEALAADARTILAEQLATIQWTQRFSGDKLVTVRFPGDPASPDVRLFPNRTEELYAARAFLKPDSGGSLRCDLVFHRGWLSSLEFNRPPRPGLDGPFRCDRVVWFADLMAGEPPPVAPGEGGLLLARIRAEVAVSEIESPAAPEAVARYLEWLDAGPPDDYVSLLRETNGFRVGKWRFLGTAARRVPQEDGSCVLLAEEPRRGVCLREGSTAPQVWFYDAIEDDVAPAGESFVEAFLAALSGTADVSD